MGVDQCVFNANRTLDNNYEISVLQCEQAISLLLAFGRILCSGVFDWWQFKKRCCIFDGFATSVDINVRRRLVVIAA